MNLNLVIFRQDISLPFIEKLGTFMLHFNYTFKYYGRI